VPVLALCLALAYAAAWALPLVRVAPNRLLSGEGVGLAELLTGPQCALAVGAGVALLLLAAAGRRHRAPQALLAAALACALPLLWLLAARHADAVVLTESPRFRTALGAGFWSLLALAWLACLDAISRLRLRQRHQLLVVALATLPMLLALASGMGNELSILKEFTNRREVFGAAVLRHLQIVALACVPAVLMGWPLAWALVRWRALQRWSLPVLNIIQTIPSIALFGLLMAPLGWAAANWPWLQSVGVRGVGLAPAVLALLLYALLPIVRSAMAGLQSVPVAVTTAARAMGMGPWHIVWQVELPLAWPVLMAGLRTAVVQTIGLAAVTALVGAGGLGSIMFDGLFSAANELVILGVVPIVLLAVVADAGFKALVPTSNIRTA
jgi:osmoprotectant transport system permease protein